MRSFLLVVIAGVIVTSAIPSGSFTTGTSDRTGTIDVATDENGIIGLSVNDTVVIGNTDAMMTVTNNVDRELTATVTLDPASQDEGDLVINGVTYGDTATVTLSPGANETVEISLPSDCGLEGETLTYDLDGDTSAFSGVAPRSALMKAPSASRAHIVFQNKSTHKFQMIDQSGVVTTFNHTTNGFGGPSADYDCDGRMEAPYLDGTGSLVILDSTGEHQTLLSGGVQTDSRFGAADLDADGRPEVLYANSSDGNSIYRVEVGESPVRVANVSAHSVVNPGDVNGDGDDDIVFTDSAASLKYYDDATVINIDDTAYHPAYIGSPHDFNNDGTVRIPFVGPRQNNLLITDKDGNDESLTTGGDSAMGTLGTFDYDNDTTIEIVYRDGDDAWLKQVEVYATTTRIEDENGNYILADTNGTA